MTLTEQTVEERVRAEVAEVNRGSGEDAIGVGVLTPLSPPGDPVAGEFVVRGARLGIEYVREHGGVLGGRQLALVVQNDQASAAAEGMPRSVVGALAKLAIVDKVAAVLGQWHLRTTPAAAETSRRLGVPMFIENGHSDVTRAGQRTIFRTYYTVDERARLMAAFMSAQRMRRVAVLAADTVFGLTTADATQAEASKRGIAVLRFDFPQETTYDVRDQLGEVRDFQPDIIINDGVVRTNYMIIEQAAELGLRPEIPMMVTFGFPMRSLDFWRLAGEPGNGIIWPATLFRPSWPGLTEIGQWFTSRYAARYGSLPPDTSLSAFTDVTIIGNAINAAGSADWDKLIDALEAGEFPSWRGPIRFTRGDEHWHHAAADICLMQYQAFDQTINDAAIIFPDRVKTGDYAAPELFARRPVGQR